VLATGATGAATSRPKQDANFSLRRSLSFVAARSGFTLARSSARHHGRTATVERTVATFGSVEFMSTRNDWAEGSIGELNPNTIFVTGKAL